MTGITGDIIIHSDSPYHNAIYCYKKGNELLLALHIIPQVSRSHTNSLWPAVVLCDVPCVTVIPCDNTCIPLASVSINTPFPENSLVLKVVDATQLVPAFPRGVFRSLPFPLNQDLRYWWVLRVVHSPVENGEGCN